MKFTILTLALVFSVQTYAIDKCTPEAQEQIDTILTQIENTADAMKKVDLEFEVKKISYNYIDCRKNISQRDIASLDVDEVSTYE